MAGSISVAEGLARRNDNFLWLRIIAALMVIYGHALMISPFPGVVDLFASWKTYSGALAVNIFFAVSGFMVAGSFVRRPDLIDFMSARILRLVPALLACLVLMAYVIGPIISRFDAATYFADKQPWRYVKWTLQFASRTTYLLPGVFNENPMKDTVNGSLWTLASEMRMYILLAIAGTLGLFRSRIAASVVFVALFAVGLTMYWQLPLFFPWVQMGGYFSLGVLVFLYKEHIPVRTDILVALGYLAFLCRAVPAYPQVLAFALTYFCFWFAYKPKLPSIERFGDPSYGIYLWGWPMSQIFAQYVGAGHPYLCALSASLAAIILGYASWHLIERPAMRLKRHIKWPPRQRVEI